MSRTRKPARKKTGAASRKKTPARPASKAASPTKKAARPRNASARTEASVDATLVLERALRSVVPARSTAPKTVPRLDRKPARSGSAKQQLATATESARRDRFAAATAEPLRLPVKLSTRVPIRPTSFRTGA